MGIYLIITDMRQVLIHSSNGHLGYAPTKEDSFWAGAKRKPDFYISDSGSADIGPRYLGADQPSSPRAWQKHDLRLMLLAARKQKVPMIVGSAADQGTNKGVDLYVELIKEIAQEDRLKDFKLAYIYSDLTKDFLKKKLANGTTIAGLDDARGDLTDEDIDASDTIVGVMGVDPYIEALENGADVIIGGRSSDTCVFASAAIWRGLPEDTAYYAGKALECASFCAEPYGSKETVLGTVTEDSVTVEAMAEFQKCTPASIAGHSMYERKNPFEELFPRGKIDLRNCEYKQTSKKATTVYGMTYLPAKKFTIKLEGSGKVGERTATVVGIRDPLVIANLEDAIKWARKEVAKNYGEPGDYQLYYHRYGIDGIMRHWESDTTVPKEVAVVVECVAKNKQLAHEAGLLGARGLFYARTKNVKGTAGTATILFAEVMKCEGAYKWTINHLLPVADPSELFPIHYLTITK